jgi:hypothetical protein
MANSKSAERAITAAERIVRVFDKSPYAGREPWLEAMKAEAEKLFALLAAREEMRAALASLVSEIETQAEVVAERADYGLRAACAMFGEDSKEYEEAGGTPGRKPRSRKRAKAARS